MLVYDPFMGIGNTALACVRLGVNYIGTEIDAGYIEIANEQISRNSVIIITFRNRIFNSHIISFLYMQLYQYVPYRVINCSL